MFEKVLKNRFFQTFEISLAPHRLYNLWTHGFSENTEYRRITMITFIEKNSLSTKKRKRNCFCTLTNSQNVGESECSALHTTKCVAIKNKRRQLENGWTHELRWQDYARWSKRMVPHVHYCTTIITFKKTIYAGYFEVFPEEMNDKCRNYTTKPRLQKICIFNTFSNML